MEPIHRIVWQGIRHLYMCVKWMFSLTSGTSQSGSHYVSCSTSLLPTNARSEGIDEGRTTTCRCARTDTASCRKKGQENGVKGRAGVIVLQNNLNFNYFGELQKRRCDSLTVCHRKINWLLLLPPSSRFDRVSSAYKLPPLSPLLSHTYRTSLLV